MKVILITNIPTPYRIPLFNELNRLCINENKTFKVVFAVKSYKRRKWDLNEKDFDFPFEYLDSNPNYSESENTSFSYRGIIPKIKKEKPSHVIVPGFSLATLKLALWSIFQSYRLIMWTGTVENPTQKKSFLKKIYRLFLSKFMKGYIVYSNATASYIKNLGIDSEKITISLNTTDVLYFKQESEALQKIQTDKIQLTYVGYLSKRKNVSKLIDLMPILVKKNKKIVLNIIGNGHEYNNLLAKVSAMNLQDQVIFHGYQQKENLPNFYKQTDIFLFQTDFDIWGLVLNEAMACGLVCLASINATSSQELIKDGQNGYLVDFHQKNKTISILEELISNDQRRKKIGALAQRTVIENATIKKSAYNFYIGIQQ